MLSFGAESFVFQFIIIVTTTTKMYRTITLPVVLCGCETWLLTLREECRLRFFEHRVLRRIFGPKRVEVTGEWRRLRKKELLAVCFSPNVIWVIKSRRLRWAGHVARMGESRGKPEGGIPLGRLRHRRKDNIKMDI